MITDLGVFTIDKAGGSGMILIELAPKVTLEEIAAKTAAAFSVHPELTSRAASISSN